MRRSIVAFLLVNLLVIGFLLRSVFTLLTLLVEDASTDAIHSADISSPDSQLIEKRPQFIPKIIHQTYKNETIPDHWKEPQQSCVRLHSDYEYKLWTDENAREFIANEYPWFLDTFDGYRYSIQRADAIRYFVLAHFGGIYIDLDDGCNRRLDPLLAYPAWVRRTVPTGISNDVMGAVPQHPFFLRAIESLQSYDRSWVLPYITVMYSTGPLFLSVIWKEYMPEHPALNDRVRVLMPDEYNRFSWSFFTHHKGDSWHEGDAQLIFWMGKHWVMLTLLGFTLAGILGFSLWWAYGRILLFTQSRYRSNKLSSPGQFSRVLPSPRRNPLFAVPYLLHSVSSKASDEEKGSLIDSYFDLSPRRD